MPTVAPAWADTTTTDQSETVSEAPSTPVPEIPVQLRTPKARGGGGKKHHFIAKTVRLCTDCESKVFSDLNGLSTCTTSCFNVLDY